MKTADILDAVDALQRAASALNLCQPIRQSADPCMYHPLVDECSNLAIHLQHELEREHPTVEVAP